MAGNEKPAREMVPLDDVERIVADRVKAALDAQTAKFEELLAKAAPAAAAAAPGDANWMQALAGAIADVADQDTGKRRRIPPEELAKRTRAHERLEALIQETHEAGIQPIYRLRKECYLGEQMIPAYYVDRNRITHPTEIGWWGIPNQYMDPVNPQAEAIFALFLESIGDTKKVNPGVRITPGGLVVRSGGNPIEGGRNAAPKVGRDMHQPVIKGRPNEGSYIETRVLGTLMPPARQQA